MLTTLRKYRWHVLILLFFTPYLVVKAIGGGDFRILLTGAAYLRNGISPYGTNMAIPGGTTDVFLYSPFVAFIITPLTYLPEFIPVFAFLILNLLLVFRLWWLIGEWLNIRMLTPLLQKWWLGLTVFFLLRFVLHNFEKTQMNIVVLYLSVEGMYQILIKEKISGAFLLALGICLKILPIVFLPYLLYKKKIASSLAIALACMVFLLIPATVIGFHFNNELLTGWWSAINPLLDRYNNQQNTALYNGIYFQCITSLVPVYFSNLSYNGLSVNVASLSSSQLLWFINLLRAALILFTFYFLAKKTPEKNGESKLYFFWQLSYLFLITPLVFPHQQKYSYINMLPAFSYLMYYLVCSYPANNERKMLIGVLAFALLFTVFTNDLFWGVKIGRVFQFLKLIVIGVIPVIPALAYFSPRKLLRLMAESNGCDIDQVESRRG